MSERGRARRATWFLRLAPVLLAALACAGGCAVLETTRQLALLAVEGDVRELRSPPAPGAPEGGTPLLLLLLDGVDRDLLYGMLRAGALPELAALLGGGAPEFPHAVLSDRMHSTLPSSTAVAWATALAGASPAEHGLVGNEFFVRERAFFAAPVPASVASPAHALATFTEGFVDGWIATPTLYERLRAREPDIRILVGMHQVARGADRLVLPDRTALLRSLEVLVEEQIRRALDADAAQALHAALDREIVENLVEEIAEGPVPDVVAAYLPGPDSVAHVSPEGADRARRRYLRDVVDPLMGELAEGLGRRGALRDRAVVLTSDHGHTDVIHDAFHALSTQDAGDPPEVLRRAGFRPRPPRLEAPFDDDFDTVLAYQGSMAYVYVADRSTCHEAGRACEWSRPPRFERDVLPVALAFLRATEDGLYVPEMRGALDLVLARRPVPFEDEDLPFEVVTRSGDLVPLEVWLAENPRPDWHAPVRRLRALGAGRYGERAGDVLLVARSGASVPIEERFYFAGPYRSWHGSPHHSDSRVPLVVADPGRGAASLARTLDETLGASAGLEDLAGLVERLRRPRAGGPAPAAR